MALAWLGDLEAPRGNIDASDPAGRLQLIGWFAMAVRSRDRVAARRVALADVVLDEYPIAPRLVELPSPMWFSTSIDREIASRLIELPSSIWFSTRIDREIACGSSANAIELLALEHERAPRRESLLLDEHSRQRAAVDATRISAGPTAALHRLR